MVPDRSFNRYRNGIWVAILPGKVKEFKTFSQKSGTLCEFEKILRLDVCDLNIYFEAK